MEDSSATHVIIITLLLLVIVNLFLLDLKVFSPASSIRLADLHTVAPTIIPAPTLPPCDARCREEIKRELLRDLATAQPTPVVQAAPPQYVRPSEQYIPLGTGSTTSPNWIDLTATDTVIDPSLYESISEVRFIAAVSNPTKNGQVEVQLFNVTDKHPVWNSHLVSSQTMQTLSSGPITLDAGAKTYRVQLKSTLGYPATVEGAKIRVVMR